MIVAFFLALLVSSQAPARPPAMLSGSVSGQVLSAKGSPAAGIRVGLMDSAASDATVALMGISQTDSEGRYHLDAVPPGRYYLFAGDLELPTYHPGTIRSASATIVTVGSGASVTGMNFTVARATEALNISGRLLFRPGAPAGDATISLIAVGADQFGNTFAEVSPDAGGAFRIPRVRPGTYGLVAQGFDRNTGFDRAVSSRLVTVRDTDIEDIEIIIPGVVTVEGNVRTEDGQTIPPFFLTFASAVFLAKSQVNSTFRETLIEGEYRVRAAGLPEGYYLKSLTSGSVDLLRFPLTVISPDGPAPIVGVIARAGQTRVNGRLVGPATNAGKLLPPRITLTEANDFRSVSSAINSDGTFSFAGVTPGTHSVSFTLESGLRFFAGSVDIPEKDAANIEIPIPLLRDIVGRAVMEGDGPLPQFNLVVSSGPVEDFRGAVDVRPAFALGMLIRPAAPLFPWVAEFNVTPSPDGTFHLLLPEGEYETAVALPAAPYELKRITHGSADLLKEPMKVTAESGELRVTFASSSQVFKVRGRVGGLDRAIARESRVRLSGGVIGPLEVPVAADGSFEFTRVPPGQFTATFISTRVIAPSVAIRVLNQDVSGVSMAVSREREIKGRIFQKQDGPPGFVMELSNERNVLSIPVRPQRDGAFRIRVPEGRFDVNVVGVPADYDFVALLRGVDDLTEDGLELPGENDGAELEASFNMASTFLRGPRPLALLRGTVAGASAAGRPRIRLTGVSTVSTYEVVLVDGKFEFPAVTADVYMVSIIRDGNAVPMKPVFISVASTNQTKLQFDAPLVTPRGRDSSTPTTIARMLSSGDRPTQFSELPNAQESIAVEHLKTLRSYRATSINGIRDMVASGFLDSRYADTMSGYRFFILNNDEDEDKTIIAAVPVDPQPGQHAFFTTLDDEDEVRFAVAEQLSPPGRSGARVGGH